MGAMRDASSRHEHALHVRCRSASLQSRYQLAGRPEDGEGVMGDTSSCHEHALHVRAVLHRSSHAVSTEHKRAGRLALPSAAVNRDNGGLSRLLGGLPWATPVYGYGSLGRAGVILRRSSTKGRATPLVQRW